jgi:hypothetical protein
MDTEQETQSDLPLDDAPTYPTHSGRLVPVAEAGTSAINAPPRNPAQVHAQTRRRISDARTVEAPLSSRAPDKGPSEITPQSRGPAF